MQRKKQFITVLLIALSILNAFQALSQKKIIDNSIYDYWPAIHSKIISNNGKFISYEISSSKGSPVLCIQSTDSRWKKEIVQGDNLFFTQDSRRAVFFKSKDTLAILEPGTDAVKYFLNVETVKTPKDGDGAWLAFRLKSSDLILLNLVSGKQENMAHVSDYLFSDNGQKLIVESTKDNDQLHPRFITCLQLNTGKSAIIWKGYKADNFVFDSKGSQLAFIAEDNQKKCSVWYYAVPMDTASVKIDSDSLKLPSMVVSQRGFSNKYPTIFFSNNGNKLFFSIQKANAPKSLPFYNTNTQVDVWNYKDRYLQSKQLYELKFRRKRSFLAVVNLLKDNSNKVIQLQTESDGYNINLSCKGDGDYVMVNKYVEPSSVKEETEQEDIYLVSTKDACRKKINKAHMKDSNPGFSLTGKFVIWYDRKQRHYFTYNISTTVIKNISRQITVPLYQEDYDHANPSPPFGYPTWLDNDAAILLYDKYDIWQVDPNGVKKPVNCTNYFGRKNNIELRNLKFDDQLPPRMNDTLTLSAFNFKNKENGFFKMQLGKAQSLCKFTMGPYVYYFPQHYSYDISGITHPFFPLKAKDNNGYVISSMSSKEFPNLYFTRDFKNFKQLTYLEPQKQYNWLSDELIHWKLPNGHTEEGLLYKPENFDSHKKYPVIFYYYEKNADALNAFLNPEPTQGVIDIVRFVSNGYVVCVPDIHYKIGYPFESACQTVVSAALYLSKKPWVNVHKLGLQGHSFGGSETNYIVTKSHLFAAAAPAAGLTDMVSDYGGNMNGERDSYHYFWEWGQGRIGATLWQRPELYIKNSPIYNADKVTTPLLIMHNEADDAVPWSTQGFAWYTALKSLGKKVWMLQYDGEEHTISNPENQLDYSIRLDQFFDHYLKDKAAPKWMTVGVPASQKGIDSGLELDTSGQKP